MGRFGEILRARREEQGLEQGDVARQLGVTQQTVSKWETGVTVPRASRIAALASLLELDPALLHRAAGSAGASSLRAGSFPAVSSLALELLSERDLLRLLDAAWQEFRRRRHLDS
ncbi:MAG TPA: helix-turn-helix transcriptional regulator [Acidimicrobiales bacterium]|nr:helix-turn-helix transcriptional regulator [Acidimicrobiales bacterium]